MAGADGAGGGGDAGGGRGVCVGAKTTPASRLALPHKQLAPLRDRSTGGTSQQLEPPLRGASTVVGTRVAASSTSREGAAAVEAASVAAAVVRGARGGWAEGVVAVVAEAEAEKEGARGVELMEAVASRGEGVWRAETAAEAAARAARVASPEVAA